MFLTNGANGTTVVRVVVADDDPLVRRVLRDALGRDGLEVVAEAADGRATVEAVLHHEPDLLVLDLVMPEGDGVEAIRRIRAAECDVPIVVLSASHDDDAAIAALQAGAIGFLSKNVALDGLGRALRATLDGEAAVSRRLGAKLIERLRLPADTPTIGTRPVRSSLTPREWEVLDLLCERKSTDDIATLLVLSTETVRSHVKSILRKLHVSNRAEAVAAAAVIRTPAAR